MLYTSVVMLKFAGLGHNLVVELAVAAAERATRVTMSMNNFISNRFIYLWKDNIQICMKNDTNII